MVVFDLDGTLIDVWERYYFVFNSWWNIENLDLETFKDLKKRYEQDDLIVKLFRSFSDEELRLYKEYKKEKLEDPNLLELDKDIVNWDFINQLEKKSNYIILTLRRNPSVLLENLEKKGKSIKSKVVVLPPSSDPFIKYEWVRNNLPNDKIIVVGDSEVDLLIGRLKKSHVFLVRTGLRCPERLIKKYGDELKNKVTVINSVNDFLQDLYFSHIESSNLLI